MYYSSSYSLSFSALYSVYGETVVSFLSYLSYLFYCEELFRATRFVHDIRHLKRKQTATLNRRVTDKHCSVNLARPRSTSSATGEGKLSLGCCSRSSVAERRTRPRCSDRARRNVLWRRSTTHCSWRSKSIHRREVNWDSDEHRR